MTNKLKIAIVTDSTSDITFEMADEIGIFIAPLYVQIDDKSYTDGIDITHDEVFEHLHSGSYPKTAQPTPAKFMEIFQKALQQAEYIIAINISHHLSGTISAAKLAAEHLQLGPDKITIIDSYCVSTGLSALVMQAVAMSKEDYSVEEITQTINTIIKRMRMYATFDTFKYILAGGRLGKVGEVVAGVIPVRPVITLKDGKIVMAGFCRTRRNSIEKMYNYIKETYEKGNLTGRIGILYGKEYDEASKLKQDLENLTQNQHEVFMTQIGPALGVHGGPQTLGIFFEDTELEVLDKNTGEQRLGGLSIPKIRLPFGKNKNIQ
ncbi:MAG: DegV family protein [Chloroflexi bacterium]|nr:DegV family protein [Chloroflexota bacterium]